MLIFVEYYFPQILQILLSTCYAYNKKVPIGGPELYVDIYSVFTKFWKLRCKAILRVPGLRL